MQKSRCVVAGGGSRRLFVARGAGGSGCRGGDVSLPVFQTVSHPHVPLPVVDECLSATSELSPEDRRELFSLINLDYDRVQRYIHVVKSLERSIECSSVDDDISSSYIVDCGSQVSSTFPFRAVFFFWRAVKAVDPWLHLSLALLFMMLWGTAYTVSRIWNWIVVRLRVVCRRRRGA